MTSFTDRQLILSTVRLESIMVCEIRNGIQNVLSLTICVHFGNICKYIQSNFSSLVWRAC